MAQHRGRTAEFVDPRGTLAERRSVEFPSVTRVSLEQLAKLITPLTDKPVKAPKTPLMELSCRRPFDETFGNIDVYRPGRWDTTSDLIYMSSIIQTGPSPGEWDGSVVYGSFKAPTAGTYLVVGNFSGYDCTMRLNGPWGTTTAYTAETSDSGAVLALWTGDGSLWFTMSCTGGYIGYLESIQVFEQA